MGKVRHPICSGEDRISGLPDELLHVILVRLSSAHAAARTSVPSRRWRHVWAHLPELRLVAPREAAPASFINTVDAALGGYLAPTLEHLRVSIFNTTDQQLDRDLGIPAGRIAPWLHFAAEHVVGELNLYLCLHRWFVRPGVIREEAVLELPACERAKHIELSLEFADPTWLRPQASGLFTALTSLKISGDVRMDGSDLTALVSTQCPCLTYLDLFIELIANFDVSIHSNSLHTLVLHVKKIRRLEILDPRLEELTIFDKPMEAHISAPKLVKVAWYTPYDPYLHRFVDIGRTLQLLETYYYAMMKRFDEVNELHININIEFRATYGSNKLPKCKSFSVFLSGKHQALMPIMLHLLRSFNDGTKKLQVQLHRGWNRPMAPCVANCHCRFRESCKIIDGIDLSSLEEVEIVDFSDSHEHMQLVEFLSDNAGNLKRLVIKGNFWRIPSPKDLREKVRSICHPNVKLE